MSIDREVPSEGAYAVSRRRRLATVRRHIARIPGAKRLYRALWTLRFEARVLRARVVGGSSANEQPPAASIVWQRPLKFAPGADIPAADVYPSGSLVKTITGEISDLHARLLAANVLFEAGLGPRVYDAWATTGQSPNLAFAVDNLTPATDANGVEEARRGIERLLAAGALAERTNGWRSIEHF